jgi:hypothetical protein
MKWDGLRADPYSERKKVLYESCNKLEKCENIVEKKAWN